MPRSQSSFLSGPMNVDPNWSYYFICGPWASTPWGVQRGPAKRWSLSHCTCDQTSRSSNNTHARSSSIFSDLALPPCLFQSLSPPSLSLFQPHRLSKYTRPGAGCSAFSPSCFVYYFIPFSTLLTSYFFKHHLQWMLQNVAFWFRIYTKREFNWVESRFYCWQGKTYSTVQSGVCIHAGILGC